MTYNFTCFAARAIPWFSASPTEGGPGRGYHLFHPREGSTAMNDRPEFDPAREPVHVSSLLDDFFAKALNAAADEALDSLGSITAADEEAVA